MKKIIKRARYVLLICIVIFTLKAQAQQPVLTLKDALQTALRNQELLKAKDNYAHASAEAITTAKREGLPDLTLSAQQAYGTLSGLNGLTSGLPGLTSTTSGPVTSSQNWNATFAALYATNINWNIFSFGLQRAHVAEANGQYKQDLTDLEQEKFQQQIKVAGAYLSLLASQRLRISMEHNVQQATQLRQVIINRTSNGLNAGVDSSIANAELSRARITLLDAQNYERLQSSTLAMQIGVVQQSFILDTFYVNHLPARLPVQPIDNIKDNPTLLFLASRVKTSELTADYLAKTRLPKFSLFSVYQERGSGFGTNYGSNLNDFNPNYFGGITPIRSNYLIGIGVSWNLSELSRVKSRLRSQHYLSAGLNNEYLLEENNLYDQLTQGNAQLEIALQKLKEAPIQLQSATDAYRQKKELYANGLTSIVDVTLALYNLNVAETDMDIASNAVWQSLLFIAASNGNLGLFLNQF